MPTKTNRKLAPKQQLVVNQLLIDPSLKRCAQVTGLTYNYIRELHTKTHIVQALEEGRKRVAEKAEIDAAWVLKQMVEVFERCMQHKPVLDKEGNPTGEYRFDAAGVNRALEQIGKHKSVNAFKETEADRKPIDQKWTVDIVHTTKESYEKAVAEQRRQQAQQR
jgi:phage terminase small subunit